GGVTAGGHEPGPLPADPGHVENPPLVLGRAVVGLDEVPEGCCPTLAGVLHLVGTGPLRGVLLGEQALVLELPVVGVARVADDVDLVAVTPAPTWSLPPPDLRVPLQIPVRVVRPNPAALGEPQEGEREVVDQVLGPPGHVTVEQVLAAGHAGHPEVPPGREDLELRHESDQVLALARLLVVGHQGEVAVHDTLDGLRPGLAGAVRLRPAVGTLVHHLAGGAPLNVSHAFSLT